jgi:transposase
VRARRGRQIAIVAVARKLAVLAWHLLTNDTDYRWTPASLAAQKRRQVELKAGAPRRRGQPTTAAGDRRVPTPQQERELLRRVEETYRVFVATRHREKKT